MTIKNKRKACLMNAETWPVFVRGLKWKIHDSFSSTKPMGARLLWGWEGDRGNKRGGEKCGFVSFA